MIRFTAWGIHTLHIISNIYSCIHNSITLLIHMHGCVRRASRPTNQVVEICLHGEARHNTCDCNDIC